MLLFALILSAKNIKFAPLTRINTNKLFIFAPANWYKYNKHELLQHQQAGATG
jgi:hypothetical protein